LLNGGDWSTSNIGKLNRAGAQLGFSLAGGGEIYDQDLLDNPVGIGNQTNVTVGNGFDASANAAEIVAGAPFFTGTSAAIDGGTKQFGGAVVVFFGDNRVGRWPNTGAGEGSAGNPDRGEVYVATVDHDANTTFPFFGWSVARSGHIQFNGSAAGDDLNDILVGSPGYETNAASADEGAAYLISSDAGAESPAAGTAVYTLTQTGNFQDLAAGNVAANFGTQPLQGAGAGGGRMPNGFLNNVALGNRLEIVSTLGAGGAYQVVESNQTGAQLGYSVAGDFQLNGVDNSQDQREIAVGAPLYERNASLSEEGAVLVFSNTVPTGAYLFASHTAANNGNAFTMASATALYGGQQGARFGWSVAGSGDMDGNFFTGQPATKAAAQTALQPIAARGNEYGELLIGAPYAEGPLTPQLDEGVSYIYYGSATGVNTNDRCILEGDRTNLLFGYSVAGTPGYDANVNSSSFQNDMPPGSLAGRTSLADLLVGAPGYDNTEGSINDRNQGRAYAYWGMVRPSLVYTVDAPFCPNSAPVVMADVYDMPTGTNFTLTYLEGTNTRTASFTFAPVAGSSPARMRVTLPSSVQQVTTLYTAQWIDIGTCCRHILNDVYTATASAPTLNTFAVTDASICTGQTPGLSFNVTAGVNTGDVIRVVLSASNTTPANWIRQPDFNFTAPAVLTGIAITNVAAITSTTTYRIDSIINVTRNCGAAIAGQMATVTVTSIPTVSITVDPYCPGTKPTIRGTFTGFADANTRWRVTGRINDPINGPVWSLSGRGNIVTPTIFVSPLLATYEIVGKGVGQQIGIEAETNAVVANNAANRALNPNHVGASIGTEASDPTYLDNLEAVQVGNLTIYIDNITVVNTPTLTGPATVANYGYYTERNLAPGAANAIGTTVQPDNCLFTAPQSTLPRMVQGLAMTQLPEAQFEPAPIFFCAGTTPEVVVRVTNVGVNQPWTIAWSEQVSANFVIPPVNGDPVLLTYSGVGPGVFNLTDIDAASLISPAVGPTVRQFDTKYYIGWIAAGGCTTTYGQISQNEVNAIASGRTTPFVQFEPIPTFCAGDRPTIRFNVLNVPATEAYTFTGYYNRYIRNGNNVILTETRTFNTETFTGNSPVGSPFNLTNIIIGSQTMPLPTLMQDDSIEFFLTRYRNVNSPLCDVNLVSVSTGFAPTQGVTVAFNAIANFCPGSQPNVTVQIPAGNWQITYRESSPQFGNIDRTVGINAAVSGAYALESSALSMNATYTLISAVRSPQPAGECLVRLGASTTAFVSQNALPAADFVQPAFFCSGTAPTILVNVSNVPFTAAAAVTNRWRIGYREGSPLAPLMYTAYQTGGANVNYMLPITNPQSANTNYYIAVIEVEGQCSRTYPSNMITAFVRPTPSARIVTAPTSVCPGARPIITVEVSGIAAGNPYELNWEEGIALRTVAGFSTGNPFTVNLVPENNVLSSTDYRMVALTDRSTGCAATLNPALTTINISVDNFASPTALFTSTNFNYCASTLPSLAVNVGNISDPSQSWTITYREEPNGPSQSVSGIGSINNFMFTPTITPSSALVTYRILSIRNDVTGCLSNIANAATATRTVNSGVVSLDAVMTTCTGSAPSFTVRVPGATATQNWVLNWLENGNFRSTFGLGPVYTLPIVDQTLYSTPGMRTVQLLSITLSTLTNSPQCIPSIDQTLRMFQVISGAPNASFNPNNMTQVCSGTVPTVNVDITPSSSYTLRYRINDSAIPSSVSGFGSIVNIGGTTGITAQTKYSLVDVTAGGCTQDLNEVAFAVNVNANPSAAFTAANYNYCTGARPTLAINVSAISNISDSWTVSYREAPGGATQTVSGIGNTSNFSFMAATTPLASPVTYEILTVRNNSTGCTSTINSNATATAGATAGTVTLSPIANVCAGNSPLFTVNVPGVPAAQSWTLNWSENGNARTTVGIGGSFSLPSTASLYNNAGPRTISLTSITIPNASCQPALGTPVSFTVLASSDATFNVGNPTTLCSGSTPVVNVNISPAGTGTLSYRVNGGATQQINYNGGSVNIGGAAPIATNTTYELVAISNGTCTRPLTAMSMIMVTPGINPALVGQTQPSGCLGNGSLTIRGALGVSGLSYSLLNNSTGVQSSFEVSTSDQFTFNNLNAASYTVFVRDVTGCQASVGPVTLNASGSVTPTLLAVTPINQNTASIMFTSVSGGSPYLLRYRALPSGTFLFMTINNSNAGNITTTVGNLQAGITYEFSVASACNNTVFSNVLTFSTQSACLVNPLLAVPTGVTVTTQVIGSIAKIATVGWNKVNGATGYVVRWRVSGGNPNYSNIVRCEQQIPDDPNNGGRELLTIPGSFLVGVTYEVQVAAQCQQCGIAPNVAGTSNFTPTVTFRLDEEGTASIEKFSVYPNPNDGVFSVNFTTETVGTASVVILDMTGRTIVNREFTTQFGENQLPLNIDGFASGVYTLRFTQNGSVRTTKLILN